MISRKKHQGWYHLLAALTVSVWGITFVSTKVLIQCGLSPVDVLFYRFLLAYLCMWLISHGRVLADHWRDEGLFMLLGLFGGSLYFVAENTALGLTLASNVSLIICTAPVLAALLTWVLHRGQQIPSRLIVGSLIAFAGVILVVFNGHFILHLHPAGDVLTLLAALMWACYCLLLQRLQKRYSTTFITRKVFLYGLLTMLPFFYFSSLTTDLIILSQPVVWLNLIFLGVVASMLCYLMWNTAVRHLGTLQTTNYIYVVPLVTLLTSAWILNEIITWIALAGSAFILAGVYLAERGWPLFRKAADPSQ